MSRPPIRHFGSAVILSSGSSLLLQRKTPGYPFEPYVGRTTLVGGFWSTTDDASPRATLERELREELSTRPLREAVLGEADFFGAYDYRLGLLADDRGPFWTRTYVFEVEFEEPNRFERAELAEGVARFVLDMTSFEGPLCWGHDATLVDWAERQGHEVEFVGDTEAYEVVTRVEPRSYVEIDRSRLVHDPLNTER